LNRAVQIPNRKSQIANRKLTAFTLIEVMVSIALVLILVLGINEVFKMAADTVGTGQALSAKDRDGRALQAVLNNELQHLVREQDQPFFIIDSRTQLAFRNQADEKSDLDYNPADNPPTRAQEMQTIDLNGDNREGNAPGETLNLAEPSLRNHRVDTLSFFTRDLYPRQTGNSSGGQNVYVADMSANEAWVTYGHLRVFDQTGDANLDLNAHYPSPGALPTKTNPNPKNFYADDWVLGRVAMLLVKPTVAGGVNTIKDRNGTPQFFWERKAGDDAKTNQQYLTPLFNGTEASNSSSIFLTDARYDLMGTTIGDFRRTLSDYIKHTTYNAGGSPSGGAWTPNDWWTAFPTDPASPYGTGRFRCNPYPTKPLDAQKAAQAAPVLLNNCTQFIVEFAGDYFHQGPDATHPGATPSQITDFGPDGVLDFYYQNNVRHIRWYGFPRDADGDGQILGYNGQTNGQNDTITDVVPVRDIARTLNTINYFNVNPNPFAFERNLRPDHLSQTQPSIALQSLPNYASTPGGLQAGEHYTVAWGPDTDALGIKRPKMIRIIATVDDPNGRLSDGQTFEYVINLP
jgi:prepilin-type N-terminal cleavage/methylation domain-containing protein